MSSFLRRKEELHISNRTWTDERDTRKIIIREKTSLRKDVA